MIVPKLFFGITHEYDPKTNDALRNIASFSVYDHGQSMFVSVFPFENKELVEAILNKCLNKEVTIKVEVPTFKGEGAYEVEHLPDTFMVYHYQKVRIVDEDGQTSYEARRSGTEISHATVNALWKVISKYPCFKEIKTSTIAEHYCEQLGTTKQFCTNEGNFSFQRFSGHRKHYLIFNKALHVIKGYYSAITYHKDGHIERLAQTISTQTKIGTKNVIKQNNAVMV